MGDKDNKHSNSDDHALFRKLVGDAKPINTAERHQSRDTLKPASRLSKPGHDQPSDSDYDSDPAALPAAEPGETLHFERGSANRKTIRELRRGKIRVSDEIDLHGLTAASAKAELAEFLHISLERNYRCVRVVHGKGLGSGKRGAVLKTQVNQYLRTVPDIVAFCSARPADGGTGAVYVLLRTR